MPVLNDLHAIAPAASYRHCDLKRTVIANRTPAEKKAVKQS
jgi:hypothetical protein